MASVDYDLRHFVVNVKKTVDDITAEDPTVTHIQGVHEEDPMADEDPSVAELKDTTEDNPTIVVE